MNNYQMLSKGFSSLDGCWSVDHRYFIKRRDWVLLEASRVLGTTKNADDWFHHPARALGYESPCNVLSTSQGFWRIRTLLSQIEYGVYI